MADDDGPSWDADNFEPPVVKPKNQWADEEVPVVKESWEDEDEEEKKPAEPTAQKPAKEKPKKNKAKATADSGAESQPETKQLTQQELEELQRASDFAASMETFGISGETDRPQQDLDALVKLVGEKLQVFKKNENYPDFLSKLFTELCLNLDSEHIRRYGKELSALAMEKHKEEKEKEKAKQPKKKKPTLMKVGGGRDIDDIVGDSLGAEVDNEDDMDFM